MSSENKKIKTSNPDPDEEYFKSYGDIEVHKLMLEDHPRNLAYKTAIMNNAAYFKDKIVMDVGTGTGFLAVLCAKAGAKKVYAVEANENLIFHAKNVMLENDCEDIVEVMHCKVEEVLLPAGELVDIIVSEWMGFYLLHEAMLDSVLYARDHFLKPDGHIFPETATIYVAPCRLPSFFNYWDDIEGVAMAPVGIMLRANRYSKPEIMIVGAEDMIAREEAVCFINLKEDKLEDIEHFESKHVAVANSNSEWHGLCMWFDCVFPDLTDGLEAPVVLSTSPFSLPTHWKQTVFVFTDGLNVEKGEPMPFQIDMQRSSEHKRRYILTMVTVDPDETEHPTPCGCHMTKCILISKFMQDHPMGQDRGDDLVGQDRGDDLVGQDRVSGTGKDQVLEELDPERYSGSDSD